MIQKHTLLSFEISKSYNSKKTPLIIRTKIVNAYYPGARIHVISRDVLDFW